MTGYVCEQCPLAFEVGYYVHGDYLDGAVHYGGTVHYVCRHCGTMHKTVHMGNEPDQLFAMDGPLSAFVMHTTTDFDGITNEDAVLPINKDSWRFIATLPTDKKYLSNHVKLWERVHAVKLCNLGCSHCLRAGGLVSNEWPLALNGTWPAFGDSCPVCDGHLRWEYVTT